MLVPVKLYCVTTDDDNGLNTQLFATEAEMDKAVWDWLEENTGQSVARLKKRFNGDAGDAYSETEHFLNTMNWGEETVMIPVTALIPTATKPEAKRRKFKPIANFEAECARRAEATQKPVGEQ